jgi:hypothetical protein
MQLLSGNAYLCPEPELTSIGKAGCGIDHDHGRIYLGEESLSMC